MFTINTLSRLFFTIAFVICAFSLYGQENPLLEDYVLTSDNMNAGYAEKMDRLTKSFKHTKYKSEQVLLRAVFNKTHREFLKWYTPQADFHELFQSGRYDCLTATALYSMVLAELGFSYTIYETNYHIFLTVHSKEGDFLFEATDPVNGFIADPKEIKVRIAEYLNPTSPDTRKLYLNYAFELFQKVEPEKLTGLLFFNRAVKAYNSQNIMQAVQYLEKASVIYYSPRIDSFCPLLSEVCLSSQLDEAVKSELVSRLARLKADKAITISIR
ncbi:MAG: hypothetical protein HC811_00335 [Flammeovirgaceae bacterium]|nr:hypothetical protein [Flammeovirgaceae bacterium]